MRTLPRMEAEEKRMIPAMRELGQDLRAYFASKRAYELLDSSRKTRGTTWASGGCWVLAQALHSLLPGSKLMAVVDEGVQHHVLVHLHGVFLDADGASTQVQLLRRWRNVEGLKHPHLEPFLPRLSSDLVCPVDIVKRLRADLNWVFEHRPLTTRDIDRLLVAGRKLSLE